MSRHEDSDRLVEIYEGPYMGPATKCLVTKFFGDDPMPHVCNLGRNHDGDHKTATYFAQNTPTSWEADDAPANDSE